MSRIGKLPITLPDGVNLEIKGNTIVVKGKKGELSYTFNPNITVKQEDNTIVVTRPDDQKHHRALHGTTRAVINNMVIGVSQGFEKRLEIKGVGYRFTLSGDKKINLSLGFSHPVEHTAPEGVSFTQDEENKNVVIISGINKQMVGETAAQIRAYRPPEPYKGKGVRYSDEYVAIKQGKKAAK